MKRNTLISVKGAAYTVPSRLIGHRLRVRVYDERVEGYLGVQRVFEASSLRRTKDAPDPAHVDFRHVLPTLKRKPNALIRRRLRDALFPRSEYACTWQHLIARPP